MISLKQYHEVIAVAGHPIKGKHKAYKMDDYSGTDMRIKVGLGACHCCDYFVEAEGTIVLIEETRLLDTVQAIKQKYRYLDGKYKRDAVVKGIVQEMQLKAYGAMLVLCRLAAECPDVKKLVANKNYQFWLVVSEVEEGDSVFVLNYIEDRLPNALKGTLGKELLHCVDIIPSKILEERLAKNANA